MNEVKCTPCFPHMFTTQCLPTAEHGPAALSSAPPHLIGTVCAPEDLLSPHRSPSPQPKDQAAPWHKASPPTVAVPMRMLPLFHSLNVLGSTPHRAFAHVMASCVTP